MLLRADDEERVGAGVRRRPAIAVAGVAGAAGAFRIEDPVDVHAQQAVGGAPRDRHVVPRAVRHVGDSADGVAAAADSGSEGDAPGLQGHAEVSVVAGAVDVPVEDDVAGDPPVVRVAAVATGRVLPGEGPHPPLQGEVARSDVGAPGRAGGVDRDLHPVDVVDAVPEEPERRGEGGSGEKEAEPDGQNQGRRAPRLYGKLRAPGNTLAPPNLRPAVTGASTFVAAGQGPRRGPDWMRLR